MLELIAPYYMYIKLLHLLAVMVWLFSTAVGYQNYVVPAFKTWAATPDDEQAIAMRNLAIERFDDGVILEHCAFPIIMVTGPILWLLSGYGAESDWFVLKMLIVFGIFLPIEFADYHLSHFRGNKRRHRLAGDMEEYERNIQLHWRFLVSVTWPIVFFGMSVVALAVLKPQFS
ncbi:MAG: hypothetical protein KUG59_05605 [Parvibaculaceae bacterium]|nr:hypothetical protein [Parvibaculaceae bacterium]